jgi:hypothetical protein
MPSDAPDLPDVFVLLEHHSDDCTSIKDVGFRGIYGGHHYIPASRVASMQAELDSLRAVVGRLPKKPDGTPWLPGDDAWVVCGGLRGEPQAVGLGQLQMCVPDDWEWDAEAFAASIYPTRAAAESAMQKGGE